MQERLVYHLTDTSTANRRKIGSCNAQIKTSKTSAMIAQIFLSWRLGSYLRINLIEEPKEAVSLSADGPFKDIELEPTSPQTAFPRRKHEAQ